MVVANKLAGVAEVGKADLVATVRAGVEEALHAAVFLADDQHIVFTHIGRDVVAGLGNLGFVGDEQPAAGEDALQLLIVDVAIPEDVA